METETEIEECQTCGEKKPVKYRVTENIPPGSGKGTFYTFCSDECLCLWVTHFKSWEGV